MNDAVSVTAAALIATRRAGEGLGSPFARIKARQTGTYLSPYKGRGMEFEEHRPYQAGDDVRNIDWRVTARTGSPHTKIYREERERPVLFCVDYRRSMLFATRGVFKSVMAARAASMLAWSCNHHGDRVGGLIFSEDQHVELRPQRGNRAVLKLIQALVRTEPSGQYAEATQPMDKALSRLRRVARPGSLVCIVSDFRGWNGYAESHLIQIARHNSVWLLFVVDPVETTLPPGGVYRIADGSRQAMIDTRGRRARQLYSARFNQRRDHFETLCRHHGMSLLSIGTQADLSEVLRNELITRTAA